MYEVEVKFRVPDVAELQRRLYERGALPLSCVVEELDWFFQHPSRDFRQSDECLRVRYRIFPNGETEKFITYKGPKIDSQTKTRQEIEVKVDDAESLETLLTALGFVRTASVRKYRQRTEIVFENHTVEISLDILPVLPEDRRAFIELEMVVEEAEVESSKTLVLNLADDLGLTDSIRTSYLHLSSAG